MWTCPTCGRIFKRTGQQHSCKKVALAEHFKDKVLARDLFDFLVAKIRRDIGECKIVSIPCCVHLFGKYDFLAALPKNDRLEIRIALSRVVESGRLKVSVPLSSKTYKNCFDVKSEDEIDDELMKWVRESYFLKG